MEVTSRDHFHVHIRQWREEKSVSEALDKIDHSRASDFFRSLQWRIVRSPKDGNQIPTTDVWLMKAPAQLHYPALLLAYRFNEEMVSVLDVIVTAT